jgi:hypothetical protein
MTEQTSDASASSSTSSSDSIIAAAKEAQASGSPSPNQASSLGTSPVPSPPVSTVLTTALAPIFAQLQNLEAALLDDFGPKIQALEEALDSLASRAESVLPTSIVQELSELKAVVASLGGGITGAPGHDAAALFHSWWKKLTSKPSPTPAPAPSPLAAAGAPIPLSGK